MKAEVTISQLYWNKSLKNFFFRDQAYKTLEELVKRSAMSIGQTLQDLNDATDNMDINEVEEMFYSEPVEDCADAFGIELEEEEDEDTKYCQYVFFPDDKDTSRYILATFQATND